MYNEEVDNGILSQEQFYDRLVEQYAWAKDYIYYYTY